MIPKIKQITVITLSILVFGGCSAKQGALIGGTTGAVLGGVLGAGLSKQHVGNGKTAQTALSMGLAFGLIGMLSGAGIGYIVDTTTADDKKMQSMIQSQNIQGLK